MQFRKQWIGKSCGYPVTESCVFVQDVFVSNIFVNAFVCVVLWFGVAGAEDESPLTYLPGKSYADYARPDFQLRFVSDLDPHSLPQEVVVDCGGNVECLLDYSTTGSQSFTYETKVTSDQFEEVQAVVSNCPPHQSECVHQAPSQQLKTATIWQRRGFGGGWSCSISMQPRLLSSRKVDE